MFAKIPDLPIMLVLASAIILSGCAVLKNAGAAAADTPNPRPTVTKTNSDNHERVRSSVIDCDTNDFDCFIAAAKNCERSSFVMNQRSDLGPSIFTKIDRFEIRGGSKEKCKLHLKVLEWKGDPNEEWLEELKKRGEEPPNIDEEIEKRTRKRMTDMIGTEGECDFPADKLASLFEQWRSQSYSSNDYKGFGCKGTYFVPQNGYTKNTL